MKKEEARKAYDALMKFYPLTLDDLDGEEWRDIRGYEGFYQVSNFGRVKSFCVYPQGKLLKPAIEGRGYPFVCLYKNKKSVPYKIHRLVALTFISNPENKPTVNHIDGNKLNNHISNLEWATYAENEQHAVRTGLATLGEKRLDTKLTNEQILLIRENPDGLLDYQLAEMFDVNKATISYIQTGKTYKSVGGTIRNPKRPRVPEHIREQIRHEYIFGSPKFGTTALAKKYGVDNKTIWRIVNRR